MPVTKRVGIFVYEKFEPLDVWGYTQAFAIARFLGQQYGDPGPYPFHILFIAKTLDPVRSYNGPAVTPDMTQETALDERFDVLMVPGGYGTAAVLDDATIAWFKAMDARVPLMTSVCTGAAVLAKAGLLNGKPAATNHNAFDWVRTFGPDVLWDRTSRWCDAGKYVTSAGVSAGTDMAFYLVARLMGQAVADIAAAEAEYHWQRDPKA
jgi:transcriptional regulator GlxA family with amidase domain